MGFFPVLFTSFLNWGIGILHASKRESHLSVETNPLIEKAMRGDQKAYEALVARYQRGLFNMVFQMVKNREETEDLVQETFIKAFNALASYDNRFAFSTWLYKIAYNNCIDTIRKKKLRTFPLDKASTDCRRGTNV
jgi:DNA-directed RNA polymerase specialized sigma24 family protein